MSEADGTNNTHEDPNLIHALAALRQQVHKSMANELLERKKKNPQMTEEEQRLGIYIEELEPQVRYAVREFNRKGYSTDSSGFSGDSSIQNIEGHFVIENEIRNKLIAMGVEVNTDTSWKYRIDKAHNIKTEHYPDEAKHFTDLRFKSESADISKIELRWKQIADILPDRGTPAVNWYRINKK